MDLLTKYVMNGGFKFVNSIDAGIGQVSEDAKFDELYNEEVQYLSNKSRGPRPNYPRPGGNPNWNSNEGPREVSHPSYPRPGGNQGWNKDRDGGWKEREWRDRGSNWMVSVIDTFLHMIGQNPKSM